VLDAGTSVERYGGASTLGATSSPSQASTRRDDASPSCAFVTFTEDDIGQSIPVRFEAQVLRYRDRIAVKTRSAPLTYGALSRTANRIARAVLARRGSGQEPVAYLLTDDAKIIVAIFGILKSGKMYVPLDAEHPRARTSQVLEDVQAVLIVTDSQNLPAARELSGAVEPLNIDTIPADVSDENPEVTLSPDSFAYILYTSGSTGQPKGVLQNHRYVLHNVMKHTNSLRISPADRLCLLSSRTSAQAMTGIYSALLNGGAICPFRIREEGLDRLSAWLIQEEITIYHSSASIFRLFARTLTESEEFPRLRVVKLGSEPVSRKDLELYKKHFPPTCVFVNALSSTETGTFRQYIADHGTAISGSIVPVGYPVPDMEILLLDDSGEPVGSDCVGEITVRSRYLSPGYWRKPDLTLAAFLPDPSGGDARIFRTGDLGRLSPDGCLHHLGRKDFRVKIRGNRVELAEIEMALLEAACIQQAVVVAREDQRGDQFLVAYIVQAAKGPSANADELRAFLKRKLPDYMLPSQFMSLEALPMLPTGKVDRRALPAPESVRSQGDGSYVAPRDRLEHQLVNIWEELLGVHPIGIRDDFFELGGNSLLAVSVMNRIEKTYGKKLPVSTLFGGATVEYLASALPEQRKNEIPVPLVKIQTCGSRRPFFFLHGQYDGGGFYCLNLARYLGEDQPFYALQPHGLDGQPPPATIEAMAASYLETVRAFQPHGPYLLGGYCNGGLVAFEMARQFQALGEKVDLLVMIDARAKNAHLRLQHKLISWVARLLKLDADQQLDLFMRWRLFVTCFNELSGLKRVTFVLKKVSKLRAAAKWFAHIFRREYPRDLVAAIPEAVDLTPDNPEDWNRVLEAQTKHYNRAVAYHVPYPYSGCVTLFLSNERRYSTDEPTMGWRDVAAEVDLHVIPGTHQTCLGEHLEVLAQHLKPCLDKLHLGLEGRDQKPEPYAPST